MLQAFPSLQLVISYCRKVEKFHIYRGIIYSQEICCLSFRLGDIMYFSDIFI